MKPKYIHLWTIFILFLTACGAGDKQPSLIGKWTSEGVSYQANSDGTENLIGTITWEIEFTVDGKFTIATSESFDLPIISTYKILNGNQIEVDEMAGILFGSTVIDYEFSNNNTLILTVPAGSREFKRNN